MKIICDSCCLYVSWCVFDHKQTAEVGFYTLVRYADGHIHWTLNYILLS